MTLKQKIHLLELIQTKASLWALRQRVGNHDNVDLYNEIIDGVDRLIEDIEKENANVV